MNYINLFIHSQFLLLCMLSYPFGVYVPTATAAEKHCEFSPVAVVSEPNTSCVTLVSLLAKALYIDLLSDPSKVRLLPFVTFDSIELDTLLSR